MNARIAWWKAVACLGLFAPALAVFVLGSACTGADSTDPAVARKDRKVSKNDRIDFKDEEIKKPQGVTNVGNLVTITTMSYTPPEKWTFKLFPANTHVDIYKVAADKFRQRRITDTDTEIQVEVVDPLTSVSWPLRCEGNLSTDGSGGESSHWSAKSSYEKIYLFLWGYLGDARIWQDNEMAMIQPVVEKLKSMGYKVYDGGPSFNQADIDKAFEDKESTENPRKVIIDRTATKTDLVSYLQRGTVRGIVWLGHGYMEPYPGCPDAELLKFESRVWTTLPGDSIHEEAKMFVRDWVPLLNQQKYKPIHFLVVHSCTSGGFGTDYVGDPWGCADEATKQRVIALYGALPPCGPGFSFVTFNSLQPYTEHVITYKGIAYSNLPQLNIPQLVYWAKD